MREMPSVVRKQTSSTVYQYKTNWSVCIYLYVFLMSYVTMGEHAVHRVQGPVRGPRAGMQIPGIYNNIVSQF